MANISAPIGFSHIGYMGGSVPTFGNFVRKIAFNNATKIYKGDPVKRLATGYIAQWTAAAGAAALDGIFIGCKYVSVSQGRTVFLPYWPGSDAAADVEAYIIPAFGSGGATFLVQSSAAAITFANIGENIDVAVGTGNNTTGISGAMVDPATLGTTATLPFRIVSLFSDVTAPGVNGSDNTSSFNQVIVAFNNNALAGT